MGLFDKLFGHDDAPKPASRPGPGSTLSGDEQALARYRYMLKTAPPETIEQAHAEAFAKLTPEQRRLLLQQLSSELPQAERSAAASAANADPQALARLATRAEVRQPGTMERSLGGSAGRGIGMGGMMAGSLLASVAGAVIGSAIAQSFFGDSGTGDMAQGEDHAEEPHTETTADARSDADAFDGGDFGDA